MRALLLYAFAAACAPDLRAEPSDLEPALFTEDHGVIVSGAAAPHPALVSAIVEGALVRWDGIGRPEARDAVAGAYLQLEASPFIFRGARPPCCAVSYWEDIGLGDRLVIQVEADSPYVETAIGIGILYRLGDPTPLATYERLFPWGEEKHGR